MFSSQARRYVILSIVAAALAAPAFAQATPINDQLISFEVSGSNTIVRVRDAANGTWVPSFVIPGFTVGAGPAHEAAYLPNGDIVVFGYDHAIPLYQIPALATISQANPTTANVVLANAVISFIQDDPIQDRLLGLSVSGSLLELNPNSGAFFPTVVSNLPPHMANQNIRECQYDPFKEELIVVYNPDGPLIGQQIEVFDVSGSTAVSLQLSNLDPFDVPEMDYLLVRDAAGNPQFGAVVGLFEDPIAGTLTPFVLSSTTADVFILPTLNNVFVNDLMAFRFDTSGAGAASWIGISPAGSSTNTIELDLISNSVTITSDTQGGGPQRIALL